MSGSTIDCNHYSKPVSRLGGGTFFLVMSWGVVLALATPGCSAILDFADRGCGNGFVDNGEACDDGNNVDGDGCSADCLSDETCGNGIRDASEICDDGNISNGDGCSADCQSNEACGNFAVEIEFGEVCDDGNNRDGDGCSANCLSDETCGNGVVDASEICDDGNTVDADGCAANCMSDETCNNGILDPGEECDDGPLNSNIEPDACRRSCRNPFCGDAVRDTGEVCDDGNLVDGDGCGQACTSNERCGNGIVDTAAGEECDCGDGNIPLPPGCGMPNADDPSTDCFPGCTLTQCQSIADCTNPPNACFLLTGADCINGSCVYVPKDCSHLDGACKVGTCDAGACVEAPANQGATCGSPPPGPSNCSPSSCQYSDVCDETAGSRSCTCSERTCQGTSCSLSSFNCSLPCSRNTDGQVCSVTSCGTGRIIDVCCSGGTCGPTTCGTCTSI